MTFLAVNLADYKDTDCVTSIYQTWLEKDPKQVTLKCNLWTLTP